MPLLSFHRTSHPAQLPKIQNPPPLSLAMSVTSLSPLVSPNAPSALVRMCVFECIIVILKNVSFLSFYLTPPVQKSVRRCVCLSCHRSTLTYLRFWELVNVFRSCETCEQTFSGRTKGPDGKLSM